MLYLARIFSTIIIAVMLLSAGSNVQAQSVSDFPTNLRAEWQSSGPQINTPYPILTWDNPKNIAASSIKNIYIKVQRDADARGCDVNTVIEHVFTTDNSFVPPCSLSEKTLFARGTPPDSYIVPPGKLSDSQTYYWSVWVEATNGQLYSSTGFRSSGSGNYTTHDYFTVSLVGIDKHIWGVNVYPNSQFEARGLANQQERFDLIDTQLTWARLGVGKQGWAKVFFWGIDNNTPGAMLEWKHTIQGIYEREMIPIVRLQGPWVARAGANDLNGYFAAPDPSNGYAEATKAYKRVIADLPRVGSAPLFIEVYNEPPDSVNWGGVTNTNILASQYASFFLALKRAVAEINDPRIKLLPGALARCGDRNFLQKLVAIPGFAQAATEDGYWATHVYTWSNRESDPAYSLDNPVLYQIDHASTCNQSPLGYKYQLDVLARAGIDVSRLRVIVTEGGFRAPTPDREEERAQKTMRLYEILRADKAHIEGVSLFALTQPVDPLGPSFVPTGPYSGYDYGYYWVDWNSGTDPGTGKPTQPLPVYNLVANTVNPGDVLPQEARAIGYTVSEDPLIVNASTSPAVLVSVYPTNLIYQFLDTTPGQRYLFVKYFYSNGKTYLTQSQVLFRGRLSVRPSPVVSSASPRGNRAPSACPGGIAACGNELRGNLGVCSTGWEYPGNISWNAWCLESAGGADAYCYQCTTPSAPVGQAVTVIGYSLSENGVALQGETTPQMSTTSFPATVGYSLSGLGGTHNLFVKYYYSNGKSVVVPQQVSYRVASVAPVQNLPAQSACPGGLTACGNNNYGNLSSCGGTWSYADNNNWNAWCLESAGGADAYCYQCNAQQTDPSDRCNDPTLYCNDGVSNCSNLAQSCGTCYYTTFTGKFCGTSYTNNTSLNCQQKSKEVTCEVGGSSGNSDSGGCSPAYTPPGLSCNTGRSNGAWSNTGGSCGCRNYYHTTFTGTYGGKEYTNDTSLNCQQPTMVESKPC